jgi:transglutaminase-like putative cysteine protease
MEPAKTEEAESLIIHRQRCFFRAAIFIAALGLFLAGRVRAQEPRPWHEDSSTDIWYILKISGQPAGYVRDATRIQGQTIRSDSDMRIILNRLGSRVEIGFVSSSEETPEGLLRRVSYEMTASNQTMRTDSVIKAGEIEVKNESGGKTYTSTLKYTGNLYGSEGIRRATVSGLKNPGDKITVQTYVAEASLIGNLSRTMLARESIRIGKRDIAALKVEEVLEGMPTKRTGWLDEQGQLLRQEEPGPFGVIEIIRTDKSEALAAALEGGELPEEIFQSSIVRSNIRLPRAGPIDRLKLKLTHRNPDLGWPEIQISGQRVIEKSDKELVLEIERTPPAPGTAFPVGKNEANRPYLEPNAYIQSDDLQIQNRARELAGSEKDAFRAALAMERWVAENMKFDLGIAFAPATEIIRDRRGTCVGYATLLASLARAAGIPSRVVMGYVYALGMFGGHAWTEIMIGEKWISLDAAIVNEGAADATRLALVASSLAEGPGSLSVGPAQQVFGQIGIEVMEFETAGETVVVPAGSEAFSVEGDLYNNPWLKIRLRKPAEFAFNRLDAIWPDPTLVGLQSPSGETAVLEQHPIYPWEDPVKAAEKMLDGLLPKGQKAKTRIAKNDVHLADAQDGRKSAAAIRRGLEMWVLKTEGRDAAALIRRALESIEISPLSDEPRGPIE